MKTQSDPALVKALARAHRWRRKLEDGRYRSLRGLAAAEGVDRGYIGRMLTLAMLAPDIVTAILDGHPTPDLGVPELSLPFPACWRAQRAHFGFSRPTAGEGNAA